MLEPYPKINAPYKRDEKGQFLKEFSRPEFEYLYHNPWVWTEKIDGTNIRMGWEPGVAGSSGMIQGRTDKTQIPVFLYERLVEVWHEIPFAEKFDGPITLYGEGCGAGIQKGRQGYAPNGGTDFILFDIKIGSWWLQLEDMQELGKELGLQVVPICFRMSLSDAEKMIAEGFDSRWDTELEGLVGQPAVQLFDRTHSWVRTKLKRKDYLNK